MPADENEHSAVEELRKFQIEYEKRHASLESRVTRLEVLVEKMPDEKTLSKFGQDIAVLSQIVTTFESTTKAMATKTDVAWLKRWFWVIAIAAVSAAFGLVLHILYQMPKAP